MSPASCRGRKRKILKDTSAAYVKLSNASDIGRGSSTRSLFNTRFVCIATHSVATLQHGTYSVSRTGSPSNKPAGSVVSWFRKICLVAGISRTNDAQQSSAVAPFFCCRYSRAVRVRIIYSRVWRGFAKVVQCTVM